MTNRFRNKSTSWNISVRPHIKRLLRFSTEPFFLIKLMRFCSAYSTLQNHFVAMIILRKCNCHIQNLRSETKLPVLFVCNNSFYETDPTIVPCQVWNVNRITRRYDPAIIDRSKLLYISMCINFFPDFFHSVLMGIQYRLHQAVCIIPARISNLSRLIF